MSDFLLIFIVVVLLFSVFRRYIFIFLMNALTRKLFEQAKKRQQQYGPARDQRPEGSVKVEASHRPGGKLRDDGEYVDFEEVKD